jgi:hypothetical protein
VLATILIYAMLWKWKFKESGVAPPPPLSVLENEYA